VNSVVAKDEGNDDEAGHEGDPSIQYQ
jgi:hypothetical protein